MRLSIDRLAEGSLIPLQHVWDAFDLSIRVGNEYDW